MGFLKKLVKKAVRMDKKVATRPITDAKKAVGKANGLARKVGGPTLTAKGMTRPQNPKLGMMGGGQRRGGAGVAPPVSTGAPAARRTPTPMGSRPIGGAMRRGKFPG